MFERFTERSHRAMFDSRHNAFLEESSTIEARHLLWALVGSQDAMVLSILGRCGVSGDRVLTSFKLVLRGRSGPRKRQSRLLGSLRLLQKARPDPRKREIPFGDELKRILELAAEEADALGHERIWTGHLLLGLIRAETSAGNGPLLEAGLTLETARTAVREAV